MTFQTRQDARREQMWKEPRRYIVNKIAFYSYQSDLAVAYHFDHIAAFYASKL